MKKIITLFLVGLTTLSYSQLDTGIVAYFPFNGNANDYSQNLISTTNHGPSAFVSSAMNNPNEAIHFVDTATYVSFNDNAVKINFPISISVWVKLDSTDAVHSAPVFYSDNVHGNYHGYWLIISSNKKISFGIGSGNGGAGSGSRRSFLTNDTMTFNEWHHIAVVANDYNDVDIYLDCQPTTGDYSGTGSTVMAYSLTDSRIGRAMSIGPAPGGSPLYGAIDALTIWNRPISEVEVGQLCSNTNILGVSKSQLKNNKEHIAIYPNPATSQLTIDSKVNIISVTIVDAVGRTINADVNRSNSIDVSSFPHGVYLVQIETADGTLSKKFIKE